MSNTMRRSLDVLRATDDLLGPVQTKFRAERPGFTVMTRSRREQMWRVMLLHEIRRAVLVARLTEQKGSTDYNAGWCMFYEMYRTIAEDDVVKNDRHGETVQLVSQRYAQWSGKSRYRRQKLNFEDKYISSVHARIRTPSHLSPEIMQGWYDAFQGDQIQLIARVM